jgi:hypothetical protein
MALITIHHCHNHSDHPTACAPLSAPIKGHLHPRSIPHLSRPSPALLPSSPLASIGTSTTACFSPPPAHSWPPCASPMQPSALSTASFSHQLLTVSPRPPEQHSGDSSMTTPPHALATPPVATAARPPILLAVESGLEGLD